MGTRALRLVRVDGQFRIDLEALAEAIAADRRANPAFW
jgi:glutamate/tyrosine decarboxylase-like PLP-dependent enzyme